MRASRLLSILMLLQSRGRLSAPTLAQALQVSVRTVYRDVDQLSAAGVPVWAETGRAGGICLREGWRTQLTGLTTDEARAVVLGGLPGPAAELGLGEALSLGQLKLLAALPAEAQADAGRIAQRFHLDPADWFREATPPPLLQAVAGAVWASQRITMRYQSWEKLSERRVEPLGLVLKAGTWYMAARSAGRDEKARETVDQKAHERADHASARKERVTRAYRLDNVVSLEVLDDCFEPPPRFDLADWWRESTARFEAGVYTATAQLRVTEEGLRRLCRFSPQVAQAALDNAAPCDQDGWVETCVPIESIAHASHEMLRLGAEGVVLAPVELRLSLHDTAMRMAQAHARQP